MRDVAFAMCKAREENIYLADFMIQKGNSYYQECATAIYREYGEDAKFLEYLKARLEWGRDYVTLADFYIEQGDEKQALKLLWDGPRKSEGGLSGICQYMFDYFNAQKDEKSLEKMFEIAQKRLRDQRFILELMHQYYREKGEYERQKETILQLFSHVRYDSLYELYWICKEELTAEVIAYLAQHPNYDEWDAMGTGHRFSRRLADRYSREVAEMYWNEANEFAERGNVKKYGHVADVLREIKEIMRENKWDEEWERRFGEFLRRYERKRDLMREVKGV